MIPILYENTEAAFISNGLGRLRDCISAVVTEERNSIFELDFEYPTSGAHFEDIKIGRIVGVTHDDTGDVQPFDIVSSSKPINGIVTFHAVHVSYRLSFQTITASSINSLASAFILFNGIADTQFTFTTDKTSTGYLAAADGIPRSVRQMLGGIEGSILDAYGGEYKWDRFNVELLEERGQARDFTIRYGVNMLDYNEEIDASETWSSCVPYWTDGTEKVVGSKQTSGGSTITGRDYCVPLDLSDKFEDKPTVAQVEAAARSYMAANTPYIPAQTINVEFVRLQDMSEYAGFKDLLRCSLCDTINVIFPGYNSSGRFKIVKIVWDVLANRYESMELGELSTTLAEALGIDPGSANSNADIYVKKSGDTMSGSLTLNNHSSEIGFENHYDGTKSLSSGTSSVKINGEDLKISAGTFILVGTVDFPANANGVRNIRWNEDATALSNTVVTVPAAGGGFNTRLQTTALVKVTTLTPMYLYGFQNSGSALTVNWYWQLIRIA